MDKQTKQQVEARGANVEAAIADALQKLSLSRDKVEIEVVDEGSRGLLGIGSREAVVIARPIVTRPEPAPVTPKASEAIVEPVSVGEVTTVARPEAVAPAPVAESAIPTARPKPTRPVQPSEDGEGSSAEELAAEQEAAVAVLAELLEKMHVDAEVSAELTEPDDLTGQQINVIEITGDDLGVLIGPRGETLDALQFLSRLMVAHKLQHRANFVVDVEGYRERRRQALTRLAERMADKCRERGQPVSLEPMSSYERRVIHMALRDAPDVYTESTGEGKYRKVRIYPKSK